MKVWITDPAREHLRITVRLQSAACVQSLGRHNGGSTAGMGLGRWFWFVLQERSDGGF